jgi:hypothetical protein
MSTDDKTHPLRDARQAFVEAVVGVRDDGTILTATGEPYVYPEGLGQSEHGRATAVARYRRTMDALLAYEQAQRKTLEDLARRVERIAGYVEPCK